MKYNIFFAIIISALIPAVHTAADELDAATQQVIEQIQSAPSDCTLGDGYVCEPVNENMLLIEQQRLIPANYLEVWPTIYVDFKSMEELSDAQKEFKHYKIGFAEDEQHYIVMLRALLLPHTAEVGEVTSLSNTTFGKSTRYLVDKDSMQIISRKFYR